MAVRSSMADLIARVRALVGDPTPGPTGLLAAPAAPTLATNASGGTVLAGTYQVQVSYVNVSGESTPSPASAITTTGSVSTLTITAPVASGNAMGWYAYVTQANGTTPTRQQTLGSPTPIGANLVLSAPPTNTGAAPATSNTTGATLFTDQQVQDWLDRTRQLVRYELLTAAPDIVPMGSSPAQFDWATYTSRYTDWEADEVIQAGLKNSQNWVILTPTTSDELTGRWTFDVVLPSIGTPPGQLPPLFATGKVYDPYLAAAYLLEMWASMLADAYDFTADGQSFHRSQRGVAKLKLAATYRRNAKPTIMQIYRGDMQAPSSIQPVELIGETNDFTR